MEYLWLLTAPCWRFFGSLFGSVWRSAFLTEGVVHRLSVNNCLGQEFGPPCGPKIGTATKRWWVSMSEYNATQHDQRMRLLHQTARGTWIATSRQKKQNYEETTIGQQATRVLLCSDHSWWLQAHKKGNDCLIWVDTKISSPKRID